MIQKIALGLLTVAVIVAQAAGSYRITLNEKTTVNGTQLKQGECKIDIHENTVTLKQGSTVVEAPAKIEDAAKKFSETTLKFDNAGKLLEIRLGGTKTRLVFEAPGAMAGGSN